VGVISAEVFLLLTSDWEGGSGNFKNLLPVRFEYDRAMDCDWSRRQIPLEGIVYSSKKAG
jgi:hypothetical protein